MEHSPAASQAAPQAAIAIAAQVRGGQVSAVSLATQALDRAEALGSEHSGFTRLLRRRALARAAAVDKLVEAGLDPGPLAGVPFGAADLFDVAGEITTAGSRTRPTSASAAVESSSRSNWPALTACPSRT